MTSKHSKRCGQKSTAGAFRRVVSQEQARACRTTFCDPYDTFSFVIYFVRYRSCRHCHLLHQLSRQPLLSTHWKNETMNGVASLPLPCSRHKKMEMWRKVLRTFSRPYDALNCCEPEMPYKLVYPSCLQRFLRCIIIVIYYHYIVMIPSVIFVAVSPMNPWIASPARAGSAWLILDAVRVTVTGDCDIQTRPNIPNVVKKCQFCEKQQELPPLPPLSPVVKAAAAVHPLKKWNDEWCSFPSISM